MPGKGIEGGPRTVGARSCERVLRYSFRPSPKEGTAPMRLNARASLLTRIMVPFHEDYPRATAFVADAIGCVMTAPVIRSLVYQILGRPYDLGGARRELLSRTCDKALLDLGQMELPSSVSLPAFYASPREANVPVKKNSGK